MTNLISRLTTRFTFSIDSRRVMFDSSRDAFNEPFATYIQMEMNYHRSVANIPGGFNMTWHFSVENFFMEMSRLYLDAPHLHNDDIARRFVRIFDAQAKLAGFKENHPANSHSTFREVAFDSTLPDIHLVPDMISTKPQKMPVESTPAAPTAPTASPMPEMASPNPVNWEESGEDERDVPEVKVIHGLDGLPTQPDSEKDAPIEHRVNFMSRRMLRHEAVRAYYLDRQLKEANEAYDKLDLKFAESKDEYDRLNRHCRIMNTELNIIKADNEKLRTEILGTPKPLELRRKLAEANSKIRQLEESIHTLEAARKNLIEVHEEQQRLLAERFNQINELTDKVRERDEENKRVADHNVWLVNRLGTLERNYESAKAALAKTLSDFENIMQRLRGVL